MNMPYHMSCQSVTVMRDGVVRTIRSGTKQFLRVRKAIVDGKFELAWQLMDTKEMVNATSKAKFTIENGIVKYKGMVLNDVISQKLISVIVEGDQDCAPIAKYVERILQNPSATSAHELYDFLGYKELPITPRGTVYAYKGVQSNFYSVMGNPKTIVLQGKVDAGGHILNKVGETIEVARISVDDNRDNECSFGLHTGSYDYAKGWGQKLLLVEFDPADAVSVPKDCSFQKLRVCKYKVIAEMTGKAEIKEPVVDMARCGAPLLSIKKALSQCKNDFGWNLCLNGDFQNAVKYLVDNCGIDSAMATDAVILAEIEKIAARKPKKPIDRILQYLKNRGSATVKQIQSCLKDDKLTCREIVKIMDYSMRIEDLNTSGPISTWVYGLS